MDETRSPLFRAVSDLESPLTSAEAAATTLNMIASELEDDDRSVAIVYLADAIRAHLNDIRKHFGQVHGLALKGDQPAA